MADKYAFQVAMRFGSADAASPLRESLEAAIASGLTTVGDKYSVVVVDETGGCDVQATMRLEHRVARDKLVSAARASRASAKPGVPGHISAHTCKHDRANRGFDSCAELDSEEWGEPI